MRPLLSQPNWLRFVSGADPLVCNPTSWSGLAASAARPRSGLEASLQILASFRQPSPGYAQNRKDNPLLQEIGFVWSNRAQWDRPPGLSILIHPWPPRPPVCGSARQEPSQNWLRSANRLHFTLQTAKKNHLQEIGFVRSNRYPTPNPPHSLHFQAIQTLFT
jgi:hypothetical protein